MEWKTSTLSEFLEKTLNNISIEWQNTLRNLDGNLKDIGSGTHIKILMDAGYVNFYRLANSFEITVWIKSNIQDNLKIKQEHQETLNKTKSDKL